MELIYSTSNTDFHAQDFNVLKPNKNYFFKKNHSFENKLKFTHTIHYQSLRI